MRVKRAPQTRHTCSSSSTGCAGGGRIHSASPTTSAPTATMKMTAPALVPNATATVTARTAANGRATHVATKRPSAREAGNSGSRCVRATATQEPGDPTVPQLIRVSHGQPTIETGRLVGIAAAAVGGPPGPASGVESPSPQAADSTSVARTAESGGRRPVVSTGGRVLSAPGRKWIQDSPGFSPPRGRYARPSTTRSSRWLYVR
jgi:hypothetical protein